MIETAYREVMLDWAVAELMSPHWRCVSGWIWANPGWRPWRDQVLAKGAASLSARQENTLIQVIEVSRAPVIQRYGPRPEWRFERQTWPSTALADLAVMPDFFPPGGTLNQLARWIAATPEYAPEKREAMTAIAQGWSAGKTPFGRLIVVTGDGGERILIEGYKRGLAAMAAVQDAVPVYLCQP